MRFLIIHLFLIASCGEDVCEGSDFITKQNMCVFKNGFDVSQQKIEEVIDATQQQVTFVHPNTYPKEKIERFEDTSLKFVENLKRKEFDGQTYYKSGIFVDDVFKIKVEYKAGNCSLRWFNFVHEIIHTYLISIEGDDSHNLGWFWDSSFTDEENRNSIQYVVSQKAKCISETD